jgi:hypothetical protein
MSAKPLASRARGRAPDEATMKHAILRLFLIMIPLALIIFVMPEPAGAGFSIYFFSIIVENSNLTGPINPEFVLPIYMEGVAR